MKITITILFLLLLVSCKKEKHESTYQILDLNTKDSIIYTTQHYSIDKSCINFVELNTQCGVILCGKWQINKK